MKKFLVALTLVTLCTGCAVKHTHYVKAGVGYKLEEFEMVGVPYEKISGHFEVGFESGPVSYGIRHESQPFVSSPEYYRTELFINYKHTFN